jgi:DNA-binding NtrC family response regulator
MRIIDVLVVDDDKLTRWSVATTLGRMGCRVSEAASLHEATTSLERHVPQLVLLDIRLPDGDGFTLLETIRQRYTHLPVLMMTAHHSAETVRRSLGLGAGHLSKPFKPTELTRAVVSALEGARSEDPAQ